MSCFKIDGAKHDRFSSIYNKRSVDFHVPFLGRYFLLLLVILLYFCKSEPLFSSHSINSLKITGRNIDHVSACIYLQAWMKRRTWCTTQTKSKIILYYMANWLALILSVHSLSPVSSTINTNGKYSSHEYQPQSFKQL